MTKPPNTPDEDDALVELQEGFGESVRLARKRHHLTQVELAEKCGMGQEEISRIERGQKNLTLRTMIRLASVLEGDVAKMLQASRTNLKGNRIRNA